MRRNLVLPAAALAASCFLYSGQTAAPDHGARLKAAAARAAASGRFLRASDPRVGSGPSLEERTRAVTEIQGELDAYIGGAANGDRVDISSLRQDLARILGPLTVGPEWGDPPAVFPLDRSGESFVIVGYALGTGVMGLARDNWIGGTAVTIRAYRADNGKLDLVDTTGSDMNGCFSFVRELHSPIGGKIWLLAWGDVTGSNGPGAYLVRVYAFDGQKFRTVWKLDAAGVTARVTQDGFVIRHTRPSDLYAYDDYDYYLAPDGPMLVLTTPVVW